MARRRPHGGLHRSAAGRQRTGTRAVVSPEPHTAGSHAGCPLRVAAPHAAKPRAPHAGFPALQRSADYAAAGERPDYRACPATGYRGQPLQPAGTTGSVPLQHLMALCGTHPDADRQPLALAVAHPSPPALYGIPPHPCRTACSHHRTFSRRGRPAPPTAGGAHGRCNQHRYRRRRLTLSSGLQPHADRLCLQPARQRHAGHLPGQPDGRRKADSTGNQPALDTLVDGKSILLGIVLLASGAVALFINRQPRRA